jgi:hypothetical protein
MIIRKLVVIGLLAFASLVSGCSTQTVRCDRKLSPINAPAATSRGADSQPAEATP